jgi:hypothetical protein
MASNRETRMLQAISDYQNRRYTSIRAAAAANDVDRKSLGRRLQGGISRAIAREPQQLLSNQQEQMLVRWILDLEVQGHPPSFTQVRDLVVIIRGIPTEHSSIGQNWISRFIQRHPEIRSKVGKKIHGLRLQSTTPESLNRWFKHFNTVQERYSISWEHIYNMDETGLALGVCANQQVIGRVDTTQSYKATPENREWVSIIETISATGRRLQCLIIFKGNMLQSTWFTDPDTPNYSYTVSPNGWTSNTIGLAWLSQIFLPQTATNGYRLLLLDGHKSHATYEFMWQCHINQVVLVYLIPHSSHILQPLDLACFSLLKCRYRDEIANLARYDDASAVKKSRFLKTYEKASNEALSTYYIRTAWNAAGIYPWDPRKVIRSSQVLQNSQNERILPTTPPSRKQAQYLSNDIHTPLTRQQIRQETKSISAQETLSRPVRRLLQKTAKAFDQLQWEITTQSQQLSTQRQQLDELVTRRQPRVAIDCNEVFASIETVRQARQGMEALEATARSSTRSTTRNTTSNRHLDDSLTPFMHQFSVNEPVE